MKKFNKLSKSKKIFTIYLITLFILMITFLIYVYSSLIMFENNQIEVYMNNLVNKLKDSSSNNNISKYIDITGFDKEDANEAFNSIFTDSKITFKEEDDQYIILSDGNPLLKVEINEGKTIKKLGLLSFKQLSTDNIKLYSDRGIYYYDITVPSNFKVMLNKKELDKSESTEINEEFEDINFNLFPTNSIYKIDKQVKKPMIEIFNNVGEKIKYEVKNNKIISNDFYKTDNFDDLKKKLIKDIDVYNIAEKWSLYLTNDLGSASAGFNVVNKFLVKDTKMWDRAYDWMVGLDKTFVSAHILKNPAFTNKSIKECYLYNESAFSCLVHLEKNMIVKNENKVDTMNDRLYFIYYDNSWKLVDMRFVSE